MKGPTERKGKRAERAGPPGGTRRRTSSITASCCSALRAAANTAWPGLLVLPAAFFGRGRKASKPSMLSSRSAC